jgi:exodeoxyribonuclease VII small subunit
MVKNKEGDFEKYLKSLEEIVEELESKELSLEKSIEKFEKGAELYKNCKKILNEAEKKIAVLTENLKEEEFE